MTSMNDRSVLALALAAGLTLAGGCTFSTNSAEGYNPEPPYESYKASRTASNTSARDGTFYTDERLAYDTPATRSPSSIGGLQSNATTTYDATRPVYNGQPFAATPDYGNTARGAMIDSSALAERGDIEGLTNNTWADIGGGWKMVNAATNAEGRTLHPRTFRNLENDGTLFTNDPRASRQAQSGDLSANLYDHVLGNAIPREADFADQGKNTENVRQVTFTNFGADFDPMVSRDGTKILYSSTQHRETSDIYIKEIDSRVVTRLTSDPAQDVMPSISPNGRYIAFASNRSGTWDIYMMPTSGGTPVQLTNDTTHDLHPSWSPDGTRLVFSRLGQSSGRWELWVMDIDSPSGLQFIGYGLFPEWSPVSGTGRNFTDQIVFQRSRERGDRAFSVWMIDYTDLPGNAMRETELVSSPTHALINPSWSPDGDFVLYAAVPNAESNGASPMGSPQSTDVWMIGNDGRGRVKVVGGSSVNLMPVWGSNDHIYFVSDRNGVENLWALSVAEAAATANAQRPNARSRQNTDFATVPTLPGAPGTD